MKVIEIIPHYSIIAYFRTFLFEKIIDKLII